MKTRVFNDEPNKNTVSKYLSKSRQMANILSKTTERAYKGTLSMEKAQSVEKAHCQWRRHTVNGAVLELWWDDRNIHHAWQGIWNLCTDRTLLLLLPISHIEENCKAPRSPGYTARWSIHETLYGNM